MFCFLNSLLSYSCIISACFKHQSTLPTHTYIHTHTCTHAHTHTHTRTHTHMYTHTHVHTHTHTHVHAHTHTHTHTCTHTHIHTHIHTQYTQIMQTFIESERLYLNSLRVLSFRFERPMKILAAFNPKILSMQQLEHLFLNW